MINFIKVDIFLSPASFKPPFFTGSMLRGAFGAALKKVVCINPSFNCEGCFATDNCIFYDFYEKRNSFHPFRFDIELGRERLDFGFYLFEEACEKLPYVLSAFHKMFAEQGIGVNREKLDIREIRCNGNVVYDGERFDISGVLPEEFEINDYEKDIKLIFKTPLRMKYQNRLLREKPELRFLLQSIYNRYRELKGLGREKLPFEPGYEEVGGKVEFRDFSRYSNRQKTKMRLGGIVGEVEYRNLDPTSYKFLKLAELIGVGKQTVFGLGKVKVEKVAVLSEVA